MTIGPAVSLIRKPAGIVLISMLRPLELVIYVFRLTTAISKHA